MLKYRCISAACFILLVTAMAIWAPTWLVMLFLMALCTLTILETVGLMRAAGYPVLKWTSLFLGLLWLVAAWLVNTRDGWWAEHLYWIMPGVSAWIIFLGCLFRTDQSTSLRKMTGTFLTVSYAPGLMQFFVLLLYAGRGGVDGRMLLVYGILVIKITDIGAYFTGRALGKTKLIPRISPAKTWEGVLGGVALAIAVSSVLVYLFGYEVSGIGLTILDGVAIGAMLGIAGVLGDLVESMLKRAADIKDSGHWIRGMGGILDVLDSPLFAFPVLYVYIQWVLVRG